MKPICVPCKRFYRPHRNGTVFLEGMPKVNGAKPGPDHSADWQPYKLWVGDLWKCPNCGHEIIVGTGQGPVSEHHLSDFDGTVERLIGNGRAIIINDC